jgi:hypothetical protein
MKSSPAVMSISHESPCIISKRKLRKIQPGHSVHCMIKFYGVSCVNFCKDKIQLNPVPPTACISKTAFFILRIPQAKSHMDMCNLSMYKNMWGGILIKTVRPKTMEMLMEFWILQTLITIYASCRRPCNCIYTECFTT